MSHGTCGFSRAMGRVCLKLLLLCHIEAVVGSLYGLVYTLIL